MASFLDKLFGAGKPTGFLSFLSGGSGSATTKKTTGEDAPFRLGEGPKSIRSLIPRLFKPPPESRFPAGFLEEMFPEVYKPPVVEPPQALIETPIAPPKPEDFLEPTSRTEPQAQPDALSSYEDKTQHWLRSGEWLYVFSSNVSALGYHWPAQNLDVEYLDGSVYRYFGVEPNIAVDFSFALSPGRFRWRVLGDPRWHNVHYEYERIKEGRKGARPKPRVAREAPKKRGRKALL